MAEPKGARGPGGKGASEGKSQAPVEDALYQIPLAEFTPARNALVTRLKKGGKPEDAARVKGLIKPSIPAWAVNQLFWHHRSAFDALIAIGERFRRAQAEQIKGQPADIRGPLEERRESLAALSRIAATALRDAGHNPTPDTMRRITSTLEALSVSSSLPDTPRAGRLVDDVDPPGFEALAALVPRVGDDSAPAAGASRVLTFRQHQKPAKATPKATGRGSDDEHKAMAKAAAAALQEAERALRLARKAAEQAEEQLKKIARLPRSSSRRPRPTPRRRASRRARRRQPPRKRRNR
jgi:hypothetical protein